MICKECGDDVDELVSVKINDRNVRVCEACGHALLENEEISAQADGVMQAMMNQRERR